MCGAINPHDQSHNEGDSMNETVTVTWGREHFSPAQYMGFDIGPLSYTTEIREDETVEQAVTRAHKALNNVADKLFLIKRNGFIERLANLKV